ncbi:hypothetical protein D3C86_2002940 [compost metagenome]
MEVRKSLLIEQRNLLLVKMEEMQRVFERLDTKIARYEQTIGEKEKSLRVP